MKGKSWLAATGLALLSLLVLSTTLLDTRIEFLNGIESDTVIVLLNRLQALLGPLAVLLFAFGIHWAARRSYGRAALALPVLPVWSLVLVELPTFTGTQIWTSIFLAHGLRGLQPFGAPPS